MDRIILERIETSDQGTFGKIRINDKIYFTLELPWRDNITDRSCIPCGLYECNFTLSARFKRLMYLVGGVNGRSGIRIHSANLAGDKYNGKGLRAQLNGCIALGEKVGMIDNQKAILLSKPAVSSFERLMDQKPFILEVINAY